MCVGLARGADEIAMTIAAEISPQGDSIEGVAHISFVNGGPDPLDHLVLLLYPQTLAEPESELNDLTFSRVYPGRFSPGGMVLPDHATEAVPFELAQGAYVRLPLEAPLAPGETVELELPFVTTVPRRFGTFGRYRWIVALNGGWTPQVAARRTDGSWDLAAPPPPASWVLDLRYDPSWSATVNGAVQGADRADAGAAVGSYSLFAPGLARVETDARFLTVVLHRAGEVITVDTEQGPITYVGRRPTKRQQQDLHRVAEGALGLMRALEVEGAEQGTVLVEVPLRWRLIEQGEGVILVSDRFLEVDPNFRRFAQTQLARAMMTDRLVGPMAAVESPADVPAMAEAVSWALLPRYLSGRYRFNPSAQDLLRPFDFLPSVEQFLYAPRYPFADEVINNPYQFDPLRADIRRFHRAGISPRVSLLKLKERTGALAVDSAATTYVASLRSGGSQPLLPLMEQRCGVELRSTWEDWEAAVPVLNYDLTVEREPLGERWLTHVEVTREVGAGQRVQEETVNVEAVIGARPGQRRTKIRLRWDGEGEGASWALETARRIQFVRLDPEHKLMEVSAEGFSQRHDNRRPRRLKVYPWGYLGDINVTEGTFQGTIGLSGKPAFDNRNFFEVYATHNEETMLGIGGGYYRFFGRSQSSLFRRNYLGFSSSVEMLNQRFAELPGQIPLVATGYLSYRYSNRYSGSFPTRGGSFRVSLHLGRFQQTILPDGTSPAFVGASVGGSGRFALHPSLVVAVMGKAGTTTAALPHQQLVLGGSNDLRGLPEHYATGNFKLLTSVELRYLVLKDMDLRIPFCRVRAIQLNAFVDAGWVGEGAPATDEMNVGVGGGIRFHVDTVGIWPTSGGIDVAWSPRAPVGNLLPWPVQIYLRVGQSF